MCSFANIKCYLSLQINTFVIKMDALVRIQEDTKMSIDKALINYKKSPQARLAKQSYSAARLESLNEKWSSFVKNHQNIIQIATEDQLEKHPYFTSDMFSTVEESYIDCKLEIMDILSTFQSSVPVSTPTSGNGNPSTSGQSSRPFVKLPDIVLPKFSGDYTDWPTFKDLFTSLIHKNQNIDNVAKLQYLKCHLSGEAEQLLRYTPVSDNNYQKAWDMLTERYDNKRVICFNLIKKIINQPAITLESSSVIKNLLDTTVNCLNGLSNIGIDTNSSACDVYTIYIISSKLDNESRKLWESKLSSLPNQLPNFSELKEFLESRYRALEFLDEKPKPKVAQPPKQKISSYVVHEPVVHNVVQNQIQNQSSCSFCKDNHKISNCKPFAKESVDARRSFVQTNNLCYNCLGTGHSIKHCRTPTSCHICKKRHHSLLHTKLTSTSVSAHVTYEVSNEVEQAVTNIKNSPSEKGCNSTVATYFTHAHKNQVLLATALVRAISPLGEKQIIRVLLDQGSQASFITERAVQLLRLKKLPSNNTVSGLGGAQNIVSSRSIVDLSIQSLVDPSFKLEIKAYVLSSLTSILPSEKIIEVEWPQLKTICLADPQYHTPNKIDVLFGAEIYGQIIKQGLLKGPPGTPVAQETALGWILSGQVKSHSQQSLQCHTTTVSLHAQINDTELLKMFWEQEAEPSFLARILSPEEQRCENYFKQTINRDSEGRYIVSLPFSSSDPRCKYGQSREVALKRFQSLERKLQRDPKLKAKYSEVFNEYLSLGHMEQVDIKNDPKQSVSVYLPHHAVIRNDKATTKVRIVFDASCKYKNGVSLNDNLMVGPTIQPDLRHIIMKWRCYPIVLIADVVKMYRQVKVAHDDVDFQRVLWRDDPETEIKDFRLLRVTFGTASAPYLAVRSLQQLADDEGSEFPLASEKVKADYYVDDLMTGVETVEDGIKLYNQMNKLLAKGGFELQKWVTNNKKLSENIFNDEVKSEKTIDKQDNLLKILGLTWNQTTDCFKYTVQLPDQTEPITKRKVVSDISRLFDPMGWISPCIVIAKIFIQKLWLSGIQWDEELPVNLLEDWQLFRNELKHLDKFQIPRWVFTHSTNLNVELHGFCDSSELSFAAVVYIRVTNSDDVIKVSLVTSKTKVAPIKQLSIPRLELCGAVLLAKLISEVAELLSIPKSQIHAWTDSEIVLSWLNKHPSNWKTFIANRVSEIMTHLDNNQWAHVFSRDNPADLASRGIKPIDLAQNELWLQGPHWLQSPTVLYPRPSNLSTKLEEKPKKPLLAHLVNSSNDLFLWSKYSKLSKLLRVTAYCKRLFNVDGVRQKNFSSDLSADELQSALNVCIKHFQKEEFSDDLEELAKNNRVKNKSKLKSLNPLIDEDGILRVGGRIANAPVEYSIKHPILLPRKCHLTNLILDDAHNKTLHGGATIMLNYLRTKYWIVSAKNLVRYHVRKCAVCIRHAHGSQTQLMGQLPATRLTPKKPFLHTGIDYAGPINIRASKGRGHKSYKGYICVFICMTTKAVHLEAISDLTSMGFIAGFKRFVARRGRCSDVFSDNGTNFVGASRELRILCDAENSSIATEIREWFNNNNVTWHFIPPQAPNFGGLWEAGVRSTKHHLKRVVGTSTLTFEEMSTLLAQIEACLNSRPITQLGIAPNDPLALTPGHFLVGESLVTVPDKDYTNHSMNSLSRWQLIQQMTQNFWSRWNQEYLVTLIQRHKWQFQTPEPEVGNIVLVKEDNLPPAHWLMGRVEQKHTGVDDITRVVSLKCKNNIIKRPVSKLIILPTSDY